MAPTIIQIEDGIEIRSGLTEREIQHICSVLFESQVTGSVPESMEDNLSVPLEGWSKDTLPALYREAQNVINNRLPNDPTPILNVISADRDAAHHAATALEDTFCRNRENVMYIRADYSSGDEQIREYLTFNLVNARGSGSFKAIIVAGTCPVSLTDMDNIREEPDCLFVPIEGDPDRIALDWLNIVPKEHDDEFELLLTASMLPGSFDRSVLFDFFALVKGYTPQDREYFMKRFNHILDIWENHFGLVWNYNMYSSTGAVVKAVGVSSLLKPALQKYCRENNSVLYDSVIETYENLREHRLGRR